MLDPLHLSHAIEEALELVSRADDNGDHELSLAEVLAHETLFATSRFVPGRGVAVARVRGSLMAPPGSLRMLHFSVAAHADVTALVGWSYGARGRPLLVFAHRIIRKYAGLADRARKVAAGRSADEL